MIIEKLIKTTMVLLFLILSIGLNGQEEIPTSASGLSDEELKVYWQKAQNEGYSLKDLADVARLKGVSENEIRDLQNRIINLSSASAQESSSNDNNSNIIDTANDIFGFDATNKVDISTSDNKYFGYDFFSNPSISFEPNFNLSATKDYIVASGDQLSLNLWGAAERSYKLTVRGDGTIQLPSSGTLFVSGLKLSDLELKIKSRLRNVFAGLYASDNSYSKIFLDVNISKVRNVQVNVIGEVKVPGTYTLSGLSTVMNALYASGGPKETGSLRDIKITRDGEVVGVLDIYDYIFKGATTGNIPLKDRDVIIVPPFISRVSVKGEVKVPSIFEILEGESISDLINFSGGFTSKSYKNFLVLDRIAGIQRKIIDVKHEDFAMNLEDGDRLKVSRISDLYANRVQITGGVKLPGSYELKIDMTLADLIERAEGFEKEAYLKKILLFRENEESLKDVISFNYANNVSEINNFRLRNEDSISVFFKNNQREKATLSINGAVNNPKTIDFVNKMRVTDLIALAGGFKTGADSQVIDVSRMLNDGDFKTLSIEYTWESESDLTLKTGSNFFLTPYDRVQVRYKKGFEKLQNVIVSGEINYPGTYSILNKNERISSLVKRAGGLSPYAYLAGATLIREKEDIVEESQNETIENLSNDLEAKVKIESVLREYRIGIDLEKAILNKDERFDIILKEGDRLLIPSEKETVEVTGEIMSPSLIPFQKGRKLKDYINGAGGFSQKAKKGKVHVVYPNGTVKGTKRFLFFRTYPKLLPGAIVLVPQKIENINSKLSAQEIVSLTTGVATLGFIIDRLVN